MRRQLPRPRVIGAWLLLMALPLGMCLALAYGLSLYHYRTGARQLTQANSRRIEDILRRADITLAALARDTGGECNDANIGLMSRAVFQSMYFREAGIEHDGNLLCTSVEMLPQPLEVENSRRKPAAVIGKLEILSPTHTLQGGRSIILNRALDAGRTRFVNLLLDPKVLAEDVDYLEGVESAAFLDDRPNGQLIMMTNRPSPVISHLQPPLMPGTHRSRDGWYAIVQVGATPIYAVTSVTDDRIRQHWLTQMQPAVIAGFLLSGLALLLLRRYMPGSNEVDDLRDGIAAGEMVVHYQPLVDAQDGRLVGAEALVRWQHPRRGLVMPDDFIALAEQHQLIAPLTRRVMQQVKRDLDVLENLPPGFRIGINLARADLADDHLLSSIDAIFGPGRTLERVGFEITERELLANIIDRVREAVVKLTERGADIALDDFGTGYSGLSHLRSLPLHFIKIDRSFVWALNTEAVTASLVDSIVSLARTLGMGLIAEGVETQEQRDLLLDIGVHLQQGWLYSEAVPLEQLRGLLARKAIV